MTDLAETHVLGQNTRQWVVRVDDHDKRSWLAETPVCAALAHHQIAHVGVCEARSPYRVVRTHQSGSYFLACVAGQGRILVNGRWQTCRAGMACLLPPHILNSFHAEPGKPFDFAWVRYEQPQTQRPICTAGSPVLAKFNAEPVRDAINGLYHECIGAAAPAAIHHWVELIQLYVTRFAQPWQSDNRLWRLWDTVSVRLDEPWTLERLAQSAHLSAEHLRRLCQKQLGHSPMQHVAFLRMQRAAELLASTDDKVETISLAVGYQNPFGFSTTFKKWIGWRPSEYRTRGGKQASGR